MTIARSKRSNAAAKVGTTAIDQVGTLLADLPERPQADVSLRDAINELQEVLRSALAKGYGYDELAKILSESGISIRPSTLKRYLSIAKQIPNGTARRKTSARSKSAAQTRRAKAAIKS